MDPQTFSSLKSQLKDKPFTKDKKAVLQSFMQYWFSAEQAASVIDEFPHASDKNDILAMIGPRLTVLTGAEGLKIVSAFTFADGKLKAVGLIANHINDPAGKYSVLDAIDFHFDKEKARKILDEARPPTVPTCSAPYQQPCTTQQYPPPQQYQPPPQVVQQQYQPPPQVVQQQYQPPPQAAQQQYQPPPQVAPQAGQYPQTYQPPPQGYPQAYNPPQAAPYAPLPQVSQYPYAPPQAGSQYSQPGAGYPAYQQGAQYQQPPGGVMPPPPAGYPTPQPNYGFPPQ